MPSTQLTVINNWKQAIIRVPGEGGGDSLMTSSITGCVGGDGHLPWTLQLQAQEFTLGATSLVLNNIYDQHVFTYQLMRQREIEVVIYSFNLKNSVLQLCQNYSTIKDIQVLASLFSWLTSIFQKGYNYILILNFNAAYLINTA